MKRPVTFSSLHELAKFDALEHPEEHPTELLEEIEADYQQRMQDYHNDPYSDYAPSECADIPARPYRRVLNELERRAWEEKK